MGIHRYSNIIVWGLAILTSLYFVQVWPGLGGLTIRAEDLVLLILIGLLVTPVFLTGRFRYRDSPLYAPLLLWAGALLLGAMITLTSPLDTKWKQDAIVNAVRLALALSLFFIVYNYPATAHRKTVTIVGTIVLISFVTSTVALVQIAHWNGWLPFPLPAILTEFKEGANTEKGREIFGLYLGDTGTHTWSAMLAIQALTVWFLAWSTRSRMWRIAALLYFGVLTVILLRTSVRNSVLGLFIAISSVFVFDSFRSRFQTNRIVKPLLLVAFGLVIIGTLFILGSEYYYTQRILQTLPQLQNGQIVIQGGSNIYGRLDYAATALTMFRSHPLLGIGFYSFEPLSTVYGPVSTPHAHNSFLQTISELGLVGLVCLSWLIWRIGTLLYATRGCLDLSREAQLMWKLTVAIAIFLVFTAVFSNTFWSPAYMSVFMLFLATLASIVYEAST